MLYSYFRSTCSIQPLRFLSILLSLSVDESRSFLYYFEYIVLVFLTILLPSYWVFGSWALMLLYLSGLICYVGLFFLFLFSSCFYVLFISLLSFACMFWLISWYFFAIFTLVWFALFCLYDFSSLSSLVSFAFNQTLVLLFPLRLVSFWFLSSGTLLPWVLILSGRTLRRHFIELALLYGRTLRRHFIAYHYSVSRFLYLQS
jgi:hypothetical protein